MEFEKFLKENKKLIAALANNTLTKQELEDDSCFDEMYEELLKEENKK